MKVIDVDAHVVEPASCWDYLSEADKQYRPSVLRKEVGATIATHFSGPNTNTGSSTTTSTAGKASGDRDSNAR